MDNISAIPEAGESDKTRDGRTCFHMAVISGDTDLLQELAKKRGDPGLNNLIKKPDENGETALHLAVRRDSLELMKQLVELDASLCDCANKGGETPLQLAVSLGFKEAVKILVTHTSNALHYIVELNQVKLVEYLIKEKDVDLSKLINKPYKPTTNSPDKENCAKNPSDNEGNPPTNLQHVQPNDGVEQHPKEKSPTNASCDGKDKPSQSAAKNRNKADEKISTNSTDTDTQDDQLSVRRGDTALHIAARSKYEHMVNLLLKIHEVNKLARNSEDKTPFEIAREVTEYHESFRIIRKLGDFERKVKPFMYCARQVSHKKYKRARLMVKKAYEDRRNAELVVATLLATMTSAAAFTLPGGFDSDSKGESLLNLVSFKVFLVFDCIAFFLSLFVCIMWEMSSELTTGDKMLFMAVNSLVVCSSFGFTAYGFMCAVYAVLQSKVKIFPWIVLGSLIAITLCGVLAFIYQSVHFVVTRARFHRLCGVSGFFDDIVEKVWSRAECCGLLNLLRLTDEASRDVMAAQTKPSKASDEHESCCFNHV